MTEHGSSHAIQTKVKKEHNAQKSFEENGKVKSFDESGKFRRFDSDLYNKGASRTSLGVTNSISHSSYNSANEVMPVILDANLMPFAQELQFDLYDYDPHELSPNVDLEVELPFRTGDVIYVYGDMDDDGFYLAELRGQRGLVPSNFLSEVPNQGGRPGGPGAVGPPVQPRGGPAGKKG